MKVYFGWRLIAFGRRLAPYSYCDVPAFKNCDPLAGVLYDDGGLGFEEVLERTKNGIEETKKIIEGQLEKGEIYTETFCAEIGRDRTEIYFNFDVSYNQFIPTTMFLTILTEWYEFIKLPPQKGVTKIVEV
ncbi:hypothetical protein BS333_18900 [Vibrio azureus]|uniref:Uncharacterized protein n=1 Tax=Vibrio azureus NBRC 104587 TaxID=1219077 RepID=U3AVR9_9VIBR|nr:hypothetical protein [Vibrio azureus]AUI88398.1 hypothetical protein BS333_18900 [Vibrio azureus]GAD77830.1 hypothetical protein VAZ01S_095_00040 [Vibrio azureus NBRC 104587]